MMVFLWIFPSAWVALCDQVAGQCIVKRID